MKREMPTLESIEDFLAQKRFAMVGVTRNPKSFNTKLFEEFRRRGYDVIPVNPHLDELGGYRCFRRVQEIHPRVNAVLVMTAPEVTDSVVRDCAEAGVQQIWMYRGAGPGTVSSRAVGFCRERGIEVIAGECPYMFFPDARFVHRLHAYLQKIAGQYPRPKMQGLRT